MHEPRPRAILIDLVLPDTKKYEALDRLEELESLVTTFGGIVVVKKLQRRGFPDPRTYIGQGKAEEIAREAKELNAHVLVVNGILKQGQIYELEKMTATARMQIWDRVELILRIFQRHAKSQEALVQIELARLRHLGPRIFGMGGAELSRQGGGTGTRGLGETNIEIMKRHLRERERSLLARLDRLEKMRDGQREERKRRNLPTLSIVGYTNAGKTTLLNALTGRREYVADKLFATLDTRIGSLWLKNQQRTVLASDTIGFIQNLPPRLISAFRSTLSETVHADVLLHVVDAANPHRREQMDVVHEILAQLGVEAKPMLYVFNKIDTLKNGEREHIRDEFAAMSPVLVSGTSGEGLDDLLLRIENVL